MYHLRLKGEHYQMGVKRGKIFQKCGITFPLHLDQFQLHHGRESEKMLRAFFPEVCEEVRGLSDTLGMDYHDFISWMLCMGCCMYNLEENIPVEIRGCTAFAWEKDGRVIYGRNNDLPPFLKKGSRCELYSPKNGNRFLITTSSFINGEEGLNEHGLAVGMTFVMTELMDIRPGFNSCFIVRYLLEKANTAERAIALLEKLPVASSCNILIADKEGNMAVVECTPAIRNIRRAVTVDGSRMVCAVNSFVTESMQSWDAARGNDYNSRERYRNVMTHSLKADPIEDAKSLLKGEYGFLCQYDEDPDFETVWSSVFDLNQLLVYCADGDPRKKKFLLDTRLHDKVARKSKHAVSLRKI